MVLSILSLWLFNLSAGALTEPEIAGVPFEIGESIIMNVDYGFINAGLVYFEVKDSFIYLDKPCYYLSNRMETNSTFSVFFRVRDRVISYMDMDSLYTWRYEKHLHEGKYNSDRIYSYDQINHRIKVKAKVYDLPKKTQDPLSAIYFARCLKYEVGDTVLIPQFSDRKAFPLKVAVLSRETISVPAGTFKCVVIEPMFTGEGIFKQDGHVRIWLAEEYRMIPVLVESSLSIGAIKVRLKKYRLNNDSAWIGEN
jgi:hypothetical protein